jgi:hypothetical protein
VFHERGRESRVVLPVIPTEITPPCRGILGNSLWHNGSGRLRAGGVKPKDRHKTQPVIDGGVRIQTVRVGVA